MLFSPLVVCVLRLEYLDSVGEFLALQAMFAPSSSELLALQDMFAPSSSELLALQDMFAPSSSELLALQAIFASSSNYQVITRIGGLPLGYISPGECSCVRLHNYSILLNIWLLAFDAILISIIGSSSAITPCGV